MEQQPVHPDYIFEVSWEICNKVGGIHTVITSKALTLVNEWENKFILIGPDAWKGEGEHPEFTEDEELFASWRAYALSNGLKIKTGRWKITGNPIAILIDFTAFFSKKDKIFGDLWIRYKVDSLTGGWDYIEPALFGYAAGKVIECFYHFHLTLSDKIIAQFHEWITGVGVLYLNEHVPQIGTVFTTHATAVGRAIAGNGLPFYSKFESYNADQEARNFNITAKHSLEKMTALNADCFTTVSEITAKECERFLEKKPDVITPNGFDDFIVPDAFFYKEKRILARKKLFQIANLVLGYELSEDSLLLLKSGRYEFRNKGVDLFIDALGELKNTSDIPKEIIAFIFIPAHTTGPRKDLLNPAEKHLGNIRGHEVLTHYLQGAENDPILARIEQNQLDNSPEKKVKIIFAPVYLNGNDGLFNMHYYELLVGFDLSVFPSYYEPWGYTPLESIAFHIPTITTNLTGFGMIIPEKSEDIEQGISIINRTDHNDKEAAIKIASVIKEYTTKKSDEITIIREAAFQLSKTARWKNFITHYKQAYRIALEKVSGRTHKFMPVKRALSPECYNDNENSKISAPIWRKIFVQSQLPETLRALYKISKNLWWTWNADAISLFETIDKALWIQSHKNPSLFLNSLTYTQLRRLEKNKEFISQLNLVAEKFDDYFKQEISTHPKVAYFCMEYGLCADLKIYSGGLGILAGDFLKEASDRNYNIVAIGLLYRNGYFMQKISINGQQIIEGGDQQQFTNLPLLPQYDKDNSWLKIGIAFPGRTLYAKVWKAEVGKVALYLLDTDIPENKAEDRSITGSLYGGDWENRLKQELLLGIGGTRLLRAVEFNPDVYHCNEGHAAFTNLERICNLIQEENLSFDEAMEIVRASTLFTTHTSVPAGHDTFKEELLRIYLSYYPILLNISWERFMALGSMEKVDTEKNFSMSIFLAKTAQNINGVSSMHENVSRRMFHHLWKGYAQEELPIGHVTNGVHYATWASADWQKLYERTFGSTFMQNKTDTELWKKIQTVSDKTIWEIHIKHKKRLLEEVKKRLTEEPAELYKNNKDLLKKINTLNENALIIGFARRFVSYKRASLLFYDLEKLNTIIKNSHLPVLFLFAGKAHPNDYAGQEMIKNIIQLTRYNSLKDNVIFIQNYDMDLAAYFTQGVDVWLNTPETGKEACGTSGMKAALNGVLNFSTLDGWWAEAYESDIGWTFSAPVQHENAVINDEIESEMLYQILQNEIIPLYNTRNEEGIPLGWVAKIKQSIFKIAPIFNTQRMLNEYFEKFYNKLYQNCNILKRNHFEQAKQLAAWKLKFTRDWEKLQIVSTEMYDSVNKAFPLGSEFSPSITMDIGELAQEDIGVEIIFINKRKEMENFNRIIFKNELSPVQKKDKHITFSCKISITQSGVFEYGFRIYPKNTLLHNRQDFPLLKWV